MPFEDNCIQIELILLETKRFFVGRCDPNEFPHREGPYCVHQVNLQSGEGGKLICFELIFLMHFINALWGKGIMHSYDLWDAHAYYLCFMRFWKTHTLLYIIDVKWLILVREIRLTYFSLNYNLEIVFFVRNHLTPICHYSHY